MTILIFSFKTRCYGHIATGRIEAIDAIHAIELLKNLDMPAIGGRLILLKNQKEARAKYFISLAHAQRIIGRNLE